MNQASARLSALLPNDVVARLERLRIQPRRKTTARGRGDHLSGRGGTSTDFADYRDYAAGDDLRFVDWNAFARLHRPYLKTFRLEEERHILILVDASRSMCFEGKLARARQLAAAFAVMGLFSNERVSVWAPGIGDGQVVRSTRGRPAMRRALTAIEGIAETGTAVPIERIVDLALAHHAGRGMAIVLSDFLSEGDVKGSFNRLFASGLETLAVQILGPTELDPEVSGDLRLVDSESQQTLDVSGLGDLMQLYHEHRARWQTELDGWCTARGGRFIATSSAESLESLLFERMRRGGWIA